MPAVTEQSKRNIRAKNRSAALEGYIRELIRNGNKKQKDCAEALGISQQSFSYQLKNMKLPSSQLIILMDYLEADQTKVAGIIARGGD